MLGRGLVVLALLAALAAASATAAPRLSEPKYLAAATKICTRRAHQEAALPAVRRTAPISALARRLVSVVRIYRRADRKLARLKPPKSDRRLVRRWLRYENLRLRELIKARDAAKRGNRAAAYAHGNRSNTWALYAAEISNGLGVRGCL